MMNMNRLALAVGVVLLSGSAYGTQILTNPDFETGLISPWTNDNSIQSGSWAITSTGCHTGSFCVAETGDVGLVQSFSGVSTPSITSASFWVNPTAMITIALLYQGSSVDYFGFAPSGGQLNTWDNVNLLPLLRSADGLVGIEIFGNSASATKLDDFSIIGTAPEPGAFWLLAAGLGTVGAMARRKNNARKS